MQTASYTGHDRERWVAEDPARKRIDRADFARDRARIVHSAGFRRLAAKTQVVEPYAGDFARNRLTHSLEVAQIGRELAASLGCDADLVDAACLAHDLGHPPFGHNGEYALDDIAADIGGFEGNAQTLRLLTRLEPKRAHSDGRPAGLNLTRAALDASCKYPWAAGEGPAGTRKFGHYSDDAEVFAWLRDAASGAQTGSERPPGVGLLPTRTSVEAQVMDWSDDVAYSVHDVEDGVASRRVDLRVLASPSQLADIAGLAHTLYEPGLDVGLLEAAGAELRDGGDVPLGFDGSRAGLAALKDMTSRLIGRFVAAAEEGTRAVNGPGPLSRYSGTIVVPEEARAECAVLKAMAAAFVMLAPGREAGLERERTVVAELVEAYLSRPEERLDADLRTDWSQAADDAARLRVVVDQVASLTDTRALALHALWCARGGPTH
ncbi:MAG: deoxyguanosinetriphosphate triphosphohydrolase [Dermatophilus congolensis]|nr:deoxyguanosinetriphosphate triphosphohydrolase [Dermatophilus congolensis]